MRIFFAIVLALCAGICWAGDLTGLAGKEAEKAMAECEDEVLDAIIGDLGAFDIDSMRVILMPVKGDLWGSFYEKLVEKACLAGITILDREYTKDVFDEQRLGASGAVDENTQARIGKMMGANVIAYSKLNRAVSVTKRLARIEVAFRVIDVETARILMVKRYESEREIQGEFPWERLGNWFNQKCREGR